MKRHATIAAILLLFGFGVATADESYTFWRVSCDNNLRSLEFQRVDYWNIGLRVWPNSYPKTDPDPWNSHVQALKQLEAKSNLYVFDEDFGYYDKPEMLVDCGGIKAVLSFDKRQRPYEPNWVRTSTKLTIRFGNAVAVAELPIALVRSLKIYLVPTNEQGDLEQYLHMCLEGGCTDVPPNWWPIKAASLGTIPFTKEFLESR